MRVLEKCGVRIQSPDNDYQPENRGENVLLMDDGSVEINSFNDIIYRYWEAFHDICMSEILSDNKKKEWSKRLEKSNNLWKQKVKNVWGMLFNVYARGLFNANTRTLDPGDPNNKLWNDFEKFFQRALNLYQSGQPSNYVCSFCGKILDEDEIKGDFHKHTLTSEHNKLLGASRSKDKGMPNSFWNLKSGNTICSTCSFMILHYFIALIPVEGNSQIFINAPSFKLMWHLNNYARKSYGKAKTIKEIFGISLIELSIRQQLQLGRWERMNIEVVSKYNDVIEFFSLPYEVIGILSDSRIASLLRQIGEFKVLNYVLDGRFDKILEYGERIFRISLKEKMNKSERDFINEFLKLQKNREKENLRMLSQNLFKLYALIMDKLKKEVAV